MEWLLAKVGCRLAETPAKNNLGNFITVEDRPHRRRPLSPPPPPPPSSFEGKNGVAFDGGGSGASVGAWGGDGLFDTPASLCDAALRENVKAELERARWNKSSIEGTSSRGGNGGDRGGEAAFFSIEDFDNPRKALPWEGRVPEEPPPEDNEKDRGGGGGRERGGVTGLEEEEEEEEGTRSSSSRSEREGRGGSDGKEKEHACCDRAMVFGDAGERGAEQTTMFQVREEGEGRGQTRGSGSGGGGGDDNGRGRGQKAVDVVQVRKKGGRGTEGELFFSCSRRAVSFYCSGHYCTGDSIDRMEMATHFPKCIYQVYSINLVLYTGIIYFEVLYRI